MGDEESLFSAARRPTLFAPTRRQTENGADRRRTIARKATASRTVGRKTTIARNKVIFEKPKDKPSSWVIFSWGVTCCFPPFLLRLFGILPQSQQAWREKIALCFIAFLMMASTIFVLLFMPNLLCPESLLQNTVPINAYGGVVIFGNMYLSTTMFPPYNTLFEQTSSSFSGIDVSAVFQADPIASCSDNAVSLYSFSKVQSLCQQNNNCLDLNDLVQNQNLTLYTQITGFQNKLVTVSPKPAYDWSDVIQRNLVVYQTNVLNFQPYFSQFPDPIKGDPVDALIRKAQTLNDMTHLMAQSKVATGIVADCLIQKYTVGTLNNLPMSCILSKLFVYTIAAIILTILFSKFIMALLFDWFVSARLARNPTSEHMVSEFALKSPSHQSEPLLGDGIQVLRGSVLTMDSETTVEKVQAGELYTACLVTCYSEGRESLKNTLDSLAKTDYDDRKKLLFVIADGLVKGSGNEYTTPEILIRMMHHSKKFGKDPEPKQYVAIATGSKQLNMAKVYCGTYNVDGHMVPMVLIVKCGTPEEQGSAKPGNRGKRDSQLILMNFFSRVTLNDRMTPLDYDLFTKINHVAGVTPDFYETVLMVDADTMVDTMSLHYLINAVQNDPLINGLCGETRIANKKQSWVTMIQVFEYFISHGMGKAFESLFGGVTCLPGCFCMWRIKSTNKDGLTIPVIGNPDIIEQYSTNEVFTLHDKNLLLLGEDRFLTTIMLRQFPLRKTIYVPKAFCKTVVPDDFKTLLSQRRRWINSTIHNLMELVLVDALCGTFCFSMQFLVFMDLLSTAVMPAGLISTYYLIFSTIAKAPPITDNITNAVMTISMVLVIFLPAFIVLLTGRRLSYIGWMLIYLLALPIWQFILPLYAFWNFDDFSWGETRKVTGEKQSKAGHGDDESSPFEQHKVPLMRWAEYERKTRTSISTN
ncbi:hypothetical protein HK103_006881 [Boothiomyces macroporosus]|uniref:chitin synthase n=1 Tax=Boothiomyces macroporosus TaxID=261099 RepID=A0AAD5UG20_9FUNG|nr:hypothetical protein HK103_006881 [Boothiomyces macroporosus]